MKISMSNRAVRTVVAASALSIAFAGGVVSGHSADATPQRLAPTYAVERASQQQQHVYHVVDSRQAALDIERAEYMSAQEQVLTGIVAPERVVHIIDDSKSGHMTAMEQVLVATGGR
jgi:hypothetical protein